jgi:SulP family sulfate permease
MDASGEEIMAELVMRLKKSGVQLVFVGLKHQVRDVLKLSGLYEEIGEDHIFYSFDKAYSTYPPKTEKGPGKEEVPMVAVVSGPR